MRAISEAEKAEFDALTNSDMVNFALLSTEFNGEETVVIAAMDEDDNGYVTVEPLYVRITESMFDCLTPPAPTVDEEE